MAAFAGKDLKIWREKQNISASELANRLSCDITTIYRYESEKMKANPDVMYEICAELGNVNRWCDWMRTEFPTSYGVVHPEVPEFEVSGALMMLYVTIGNVHDMERKVLYAGSKGKIDDCLKAELELLVGVSQLLLNMIACKKGSN